MMKTTKLTMSIVAILFVASTVFAQKPKEETPDDISNNMTEYVHGEVNLTNDQKVILKKKAKEYAKKLQQARAMSDKEASYVFMKTVTDEYQAAQDSVLTAEQIAQKERRFKERIEKIIKDANSKK